MDTDDPVLPQLKKLREGRGLTPERLKASGAVMSSLATSDPVEALQSLKQMLAEMGDSEQTRSLQVDFGLNLPDLLSVEPSSRDRTYLGSRRASYADLIGRDVKTLARWSDKALADFRGKLLADTFTGHLYVVATVQNDRILGCTLTREDLSDEAVPITERTSLEHQNPQDSPSLPCLVYAFPRDWKPATLTLAASFTKPVSATEAWGIAAESFFDLCFGHERYPLKMDDDTVTVKFVRPRRDRLYALWWRGPHSPSRRPTVSPEVQPEPHTTEP